jgi:hypothetical protein
MNAIPRISKRYIPCVAGLLFLLAFGVPRASADAISLDLTVPNSGINAFTGPYANVTLTWISATSATVTFTAYPGFQIIDGGALDLNVNGTATPGSYVVHQIDSFHVNDPSDWHNVPGMVDGFGTFNLSVNMQDGYGSAVQWVMFTLTGTGTSWTDAASVLTPNSGGFLAAAHIAVCGETPCSKDVDALATGYATNGPPSQVPEPASIALFGSGLVTLAGMIRRRRKNISAS